MRESTIFFSEERRETVSVQREKKYWEREKRNTEKRKREKFHSQWEKEESKRNGNIVKPTARSATQRFLIILIWDNQAPHMMILLPPYLEQEREREREIERNTSLSLISSGLFHSLLSHIFSFIHCLPFSFFLLFSSLLGSNTHQVTGREKTHFLEPQRHVFVQLKKGKVN